MSTAGPNFAGSGSGWTNSGNVTADDGAYATSSWSRIFVDGGWEPVPTAYLTATGFGFALGAGDTVNGVTVTVKAKRSASPDGTLYAFLAVGGVQKGSAKSGTLNSSGDTTFTFGSSADGWGAGLVGSDANALQVVVYADPSSGSGTSTVSVDYVKVEVDYGDSTPNAFTFTDLTGQPTATLVTSDAISVTGITVPAIISVTAGLEWEKNNSGVWSSSPGTVNNLDTVKLRMTTSALNGATITGNCTIGGVADTWATTTFVADTTPDAFQFNDISGCDPSSVYYSNIVTVSGINTAASVSVTGGFVSINGGPQVTSGTVSNGGTVQAIGTSSGAFLGSVSVNVTIGGVSEPFVIDTRAADTTPNAYSWTDVPAASVSTVYTSNVVTVAGVEAGFTCNFSTAGTGSSHQYSKNGAAFAALPASIALANGDTLQLRMTSPAGVSATGDITTSMNGVVDTWSVTTGDNTPDAFSFTTQTGVAPGSTRDSNVVTITGINVAAAVNVTGGATVSIAGGAQVASGTITVGQTLAVRVRAPLRWGQSITVNVTVGTVTVPWTVTNAAGSSGADF